jgi:hypothetical protein
MTMCAEAGDRAAIASQRLSSGHRLAVFAAAVRPWRSDVVLAASYFDEKRVEFLWGDHLVTKEPAARAALRDARCDFGASGETPIVVDVQRTGEGDSRGYATLSCELPPAFAHGAAAEMVVRIREAATGLDLPVKLCAQARAPSKATLCTHAVIYGTLVDTEKGLPRVAEWIAYHSLLGVDAFSV